MSCNLVEVYRHFRGSLSQADSNQVVKQISLFDPEDEGKCPSEMSVNCARLHGITSSKTVPFPLFAYLWFI
jgi:hypothetical protein